MLGVREDTGELLEEKKNIQSLRLLPEVNAAILTVRGDFRQDRKQSSKTYSLLE
jgi:hypothetical protein